MEALWSVTHTDTNRNVWDSYARQGGRIGAGGFGFVYKAQSRETHEMVAVKAVPKLDLKRAAPQTAPEQLVQMRRRDAQRLREEIKIMRLLDHPNIVMLYETFEDAENVFLAMELCSGGELLGFLLESGYHTELQAASIMRQVLSAVRYMHSVQVCHRDLKHSNTLLLSHAPCHENVVKVVDFGLACQFTPGEVMRQCAGTVVYVAPQADGKICITSWDGLQVLECRYDHRVDVWSCGVLLYILLCGYPPFRGETDAAIMTAIRRGNYSFPSWDWSIISENAKSLIRSLLKMKVKDRITIDDALEHSWIQDPPREGAQLSKALDRIRKFMAHQRQTQDVNPAAPNEHPAEAAGGPMKCNSQSSIATRIPHASSPGAWFQEQFAALSAAVGSVMSKTKKGSPATSEEKSSETGSPDPMSPMQKDMSPSKVFLMKHLEEDERQAHQAKMILEELSPASLVFRQKHVEDTPKGKELIEEASPSRPTGKASVREEASPSSQTRKASAREDAVPTFPAALPPRAATEARRPSTSVPSSTKTVEVPFSPPVWLEPLPGSSLMDLSSTEKPTVDAFDDLPPPPDPPEDSPADSDPETAPDRAFVGQPLEFFSKTAQRWLPCEVINVRSDLAIMVSVKPNTWLTIEDQKARIRSPQLKDTQMTIIQDLDDCVAQRDMQLKVGQRVEYLSASAGRWIPCEVTMVDAEHSIQLDVKPGCWIPLRYQRKHLRLAGRPAPRMSNDGTTPKMRKASGFHHYGHDGELEYYSLNLTAWIPCVILEEEAATGNVVIDALPYAWITPAQQASYLRPSNPELHMRIPLVGDKVVYYSASHKRWIPTIITDVGDKDEVELEIKPGVWLQQDAQKSVLRWCASKL